MRKPIPEWEDRYEADENGIVYSLRTGKPVYSTPDTCGYLITQLSRKGKRHTKAVHRIIAITFLGSKPEEHLTINHIDGNKLNNAVSNLEYINRSEQMHHAYRLGLKKPVRNSNQKLTPEQVREIRKLYKKGVKGSGASVLGRLYGVEETTVLNIIKGNTYGWVN